MFRYGPLFWNLITFKFQCLKNSIIDVEKYKILALFWQIPSDILTFLVTSEIKMRQRLSKKPVVSII